LFDALQKIGSPFQSIPQHCATNFRLFYSLVEDLRTRTRLIEHLKQHGIHAVFH
jgi:hypothetical protein